MVSSFILLAKVQGMYYKQNFKTGFFLTVLTHVFDATFSFKSKLVFFLRLQAAPFPEIKSTHSLVAKHVTPEKWEKLAEHKTATSGFTLAKVRKILCYIFF